MVDDIAEIARYNPELPTIIVQNKQEGVCSSIFGTWDEEALAVALGHACASAFDAMLAMGDLTGQPINKDAFLMRVVDRANQYIDNRKDTDIKRRQYVKVLPPEDGG